MKVPSMIFLLILAPFAWSQTDTLKLAGSIGPYPIEMEIFSSDTVAGTFSGRYRYQNKTDYLAIEGEVLDGYIFMTEMYEGEESGHFYLERRQDSLVGKWCGRKGYDSYLVMGKQGRSMLRSKRLSDYAANTNESISGSYGTEYYFLNDMWYSEESPQMEIGFNGGYALIEEVDSKTIRFQVEVLVGPTYHIAYASGIAKKKGKKYIYEEGSAEELCRITIEFENGELYMEASASFECGFGARASLDHYFDKISDEVEFSEDASLSKIKSKI